jgi:hypothetical protein
MNSIDQAGGTMTNCYFIKQNKYFFLFFLYITQLSSLIVEQEYAINFDGNEDQFKIYTVLKN